MTTVSKGTERKRPRMGLPTRGPMHLWPTVDPDIPCQVASRHSLTPFLRAGPLYHLFRPASQHHWTPSSCLKKSIQVRGRSPPRTLGPDDPLFIRGSSEAAAIVQIFLNATSIGTTTADATGGWVFDYTGTTLARGSHTFSATSMDAAGNTTYRHRTMC